ncbi:MAG TPA: ATP-binding protein [Candidatus Paceibacterota bacterium]
MNLFSTSSLILSLSSIFFSLIVYRTDKNNRVSKAWLYSSISFSLWALGLYGVTSTASIHNALLWQHLLDVSAIFLPALYFNFISELFKFDNAKWRALFLWTSGAIAIFSFTPLFKLGVMPKFDFFWVNPGPYYVIFPAYFATHGVIASAILIYKLIQEWNNKVARGQIRNTMIAGLMGYAGGSTNFFPQFFDSYPYGNYLVVFFIVFMVYGVLKYKLLSTKVISAQVFSAALVMVFLFNILRSEVLSQWITNFVIFIFVSFFSLLLVRSINEEVRARQRIEELAQDLEKTNERLRELDQQKSEFVSLASHQLRGPLTAVKGYASMLLDGDFGEIKEGVKDAIEKIFKSTQDLVILVGDYLDVSRIEQGRMQYDFSTFDVRDVVGTVVTELRPNVDLAKLSIDFDYDLNGNFRVNADQGKIKQVVGNLIDNSIKYTQKGGIHVWITNNKPGKILISISDTGVGIHKDVLPRLFEKFTRAPDASKTNIMGTGLGLYVAKKMIEAHQGKIWAESSGPGKGATFFIELNEVRSDPANPMILRDGEITSRQIIS